MTQREANAWIDEHHRHLSAPRGDIFRVAAARPAGENDEVILGVAIVGRPKARKLQDGRTCEVTRLASNGAKNVCSFLYARAVEAARAMGYKRIFTYTLEEESGHSLRASGWTEDGTTSGGEWSRPSRSRGASEQTCRKTRWVKHL